MGNIGKPSAGCAVCRARHYKCDEQLPSCGNCVKSGLKCPGYRSQFDIAWRDQNLVAQRGVQRRRKANEKAERRKRQQVSSSSDMPRPLPQDFEGYAISFFFSTYVMLPKDVEAEHTFLSYLFPVWTNMTPQSPLKPAVAAVASCSLEAWSNFKPGAPLSRSRSHYLEGLITLRKSLEHPTEIGDDTLMASLMLEMYEGLQTFFAGERYRSPHVVGTMALMQYRKSQPLPTKQSRIVLFGARNQIVTKAIAKSMPVPSSLGSEPKLDLPSSPRSRLEDLNVKAANLLARAQSIQSATTDTVKDIWKQAMTLDGSFLDWCNSLPSDWYCVRVSKTPEEIPQSVRDQGLYQDYCDVYKSLFVASTFNLYRCARIKFQQIILACTRRLSSNDGPASIASSPTLQILQDMADGVCASVPFHLGNRANSGRIGDKDKYPRHQVAAFASASVTEVDHCRIAAAFGGWMLAPRLGELLALGEPPLRAGQRQWMGRQMYRLMTIYVVQGCLKPRPCQRAP